jgi:hypothetical protein
MLLAPFGKKKKAFIYSCLFRSIGFMIHQSFRQRIALSSVHNNYSGKNDKKMTVQDHRKKPPGCRSLRNGSALFFLQQSTG